MERLTEWVKDCPEPEEIYGVWVKDHDYIAAARRLAEYEDTGLMPNDVLDLIGAHGMAILELVEAKEREQVRHGRWICQQSGFGYSVWKCSICGRVLLPQTSPLLSDMEHLNDLYPYCHCGEKMDGGAEENG